MPWNPEDAPETHSSVHNQRQDLPHLNGNPAELCFIFEGRARVTWLPRQVIHLSDDDKKIIRDLRAQVAKQTAPQNRARVARQIDAATAQQAKNNMLQTEGLSPVPGRIMGTLKQKPLDNEIRRRHVGMESLALIARRAIVGIRRLRASEELVMYDTAPLPNAEYMMTPLSLIGNPDGTADLLVTEVSSEIIIAGDYTIGAGAGGTEVGPADPKLSIVNMAKYMFLQNQGNQPIYVCVDGEYDPVAKALTKNTTPASGTGALLGGSGTLDISHLMKANPRLISPSGNQTVNIIISR